MYIYGRKMSLRCKKGWDFAKNTSFAYQRPATIHLFSRLGANLDPNPTFAVYTCICDDVHIKYMYIYEDKMSVKSKKGLDIAENTSFSHTGHRKNSHFSHSVQTLIKT